MLTKKHNPDILTCIANLSSDEVFTPPKVTNQVLDMLPNELWSNEKITFLDPVSKSGVFLREITKRLIDGLKSKIPNLEDRVEHILRNQVYGIGITELTSLISRRTLYFSKYANGKYSIVKFDDSQGNLIFFKSEHTWEGKSCRYCGVSKEMYERGDNLESYSYSFIHSENPEKLFNMKFDVIVGNPPYQMNDGGGTGSSAVPLYHKFIQTSKKLNPRFLSMIIPSRWFSGGKGLDDFRDEMLSDSRIRKLIDYPLSSMCFPGVQIEGGVCYFLWDRDNHGKCEVKTILPEKESTMIRPLRENGSETFIRYNESISIFRKVKSKNEITIDRIISSRKPFGLPSTFNLMKKKPFDNSIKIYANKKVGYITKQQVSKNIQWVKEFKVFITTAYGLGSLPSQVINKPFIGLPNSCSTETYIMFGPLPPPPIKN